MLQCQQTKRWWKTRMWEPSLENTPQVFCFFLIPGSSTPSAAPIHSESLTEHTPISAQSQPACVWEWDVFVFHVLGNNGVSAPLHHDPWLSFCVSLHCGPWNLGSLKQRYTHFYLKSAFRFLGDLKHSDLIMSYKTQTCHLSRTFHVSPLIYREHCKGISHCSAPTLLDVQLHPEHPVFSVICGMQLTITHGRVKETASRLLDLAKHSD